MRDNVHRKCLGDFRSWFRRIPLRSCPLNKPSKTEQPHRHLPPKTLLLPADLLHAGDFLLLNLLAYIPSLLLALNIVSSVWNPVSQHSCRPPISENTPLISSWFQLCSTPFTAQQTCFLWPGPARIPPHHTHLHFLCLIVLFPVIYVITSPFFSHADGFMFGRAAH